MQNSLNSKKIIVNAILIVLIAFIAITNYSSTPLIPSSPRSIKNQLNDDLVYVLKTNNQVISEEFKKYPNQFGSLKLDTPEVVDASLTDGDNTYTYTFYSYLKNTGDIKIGYHGIFTYVLSTSNKWQLSNYDVSRIYDLSGLSGEWNGTSKREGNFFYNELNYDVCIRFDSADKSTVTGIVQCTNLLTNEIEPAVNFSGTWNYEDNTLVLTLDGGITVDNYTSITLRYHPKEHTLSSTTGTYTKTK